MTTPLNLKSIIEALLLSSDEPLSADKLHKIISNKQKITKADVDMVYEKAAGWRDNVKMFTTDTATMEQALMDEEVWAALCWNESSWNSGYPMMSPKEGTLTWSCGLVIHLSLIHI